MVPLLSAVIVEIRVYHVDTLNLLAGESVSIAGYLAVSYRSRPPNPVSRVTNRQTGVPIEPPTPQQL
jgi:hypothetical protein